MAIPLRALPRLFIPGAVFEEELVAIPKDEYNKLHKVLRLSKGAEIAILPNDGTIVRCSLEGPFGKFIESTTLETEASVALTLLQALPKPDSMDDVVRMGSEMGVLRFILFPSERSVVRWTPDKTRDRLKRLETIAREACEVAFRARLPVIEFLPSLPVALAACPNCFVLSELEGVARSLARAVGNSRSVSLMIGPEGGWAPRELPLIANRAVSLGPRVLRVSTAAAAACAAVLFQD